jgi:hypothetical protein
MAPRRLRADGQTVDGTLAFPTVSYAEGLRFPQGIMRIYEGVMTWLIAAKARVQAQHLRSRHGQTRHVLVGRQFKDGLQCRHFYKDKC